MKKYQLLVISAVLVIALAVSTVFVVKFCRNSEDRLNSLTEKVESVDLSALDAKPQEQPLVEESPEADDDVIVLEEINLDEAFGEAAVPQSGAGGGNNAAAQPAAPQQSSGGASSGSSEGIIQYNGSGEISTPIMIFE